MTENKRGRGKVRDEALRLSILQAAAEVLLQHGYRRFTMEGVAARAGASKVTLYKWWASKGALALDAYVHEVTDALAFPQSSSPRNDVEAQLAALIVRLTTTPAGRAIKELLGAAQEDDQLKAQLLVRYLHPRREMAAAAFARMLGWSVEDDRERLDLITDQVYGAIYNRLLFGIEPLDTNLPGRLLDFWTPASTPILKGENS